jgi:diguanylate cyclase (GGDEF)-like protein/PAS domain S-box-containing protein
VTIYSSSIKVLLVENDLADVKLTNYFSVKTNQKQFELIRVNQIEDGLNYLRHHYSDIVLLDLNLSNSDGLNTLRKVQTIITEIPIIVFTEVEEEEIAIAALKEGAQDYLVKGEISHQLLKKSIFSAIERKKVEQDNLQLISSLNQSQELLETVTNSTSVLIWMTDAEGNSTFFNQAWLNFTGQTLETTIIAGWMARIHPEDIPKCLDAYQSALEKFSGFQIEYRLLRFDRKYRWVLNTAVRRYTSDGKLAGLVGSCLDITQRKQIEDKLIQQAESNRILAEITQNIHSSLDLDVILQTAVEEVYQLLQAEKIFIVKVHENHLLTLLFESVSTDLSPSCEISTTANLSIDEFSENCDKLTAGKIVAQENVEPIRVVTKNDTPLPKIPYSILLVPIISEAKLWGLLCAEQASLSGPWQFEDIKLLDRVAKQLGVAIKQSELYRQLEEANKELEKLSVIDELTKVANRRKFNRYIASEWQRLAREKAPLALILCDIDYFKLYNDTYGHQAGDRCLKLVAQAISKAVKRPADLVARYGGEEFAVVLPNTSIEGAEYLAQQIRLYVEALQLPHINSSVDLYITLSLGVSGCIPKHNSVFDALIAAADSGLYQAKELGRNQVVRLNIE